MPRVTLPPGVTATLIVPAVCGLLLFAEAVFAPANLGIDALRALALASSLGVLFSLVAIAWRQRRIAARSRLAAAEVRRILEGDLHRFLPVATDDPLAELSAAVNELVDSLRQRHVGAEAERAFERAMVRESPNGLVITDAQGRVRRYNPAFESLMPIDGDAIGRPPSASIPVVELQEVIDETGRTRAPSERTASVGRREVLVRAVPLADGEGCLGVVLDITSVRQAERARREFVANVSHELRTPITAVVGYAESLLQDRDELPPWSHSMVEAIDRNARRLGALIEDVLHLSRIEARQGDLALVHEPVRQLVGEVMTRSALAARQKGIALVLVDGLEVDARVNVDAFEHALGNLVDNAIKYTPAGGRVAVSVVPGDGTIDVAVTDDGIGIDPTHHERIFERFYRVDPGRSRDVGGTGLGLALVKHLCLAMQAEVVLESDVGRGSTFTLRLPA